MSVNWKCYVSNLDDMDTIRLGFKASDGSTIDDITIMEQTDINNIQEQSDTSVQNSITALTNANDALSKATNIQTTIDKLLRSGHFMLQSPNPHHGTVLRVYIIDCFGKKITPTSDVTFTYNLSGETKRYTNNLMTRESDCWSRTNFLPSVKGRDCNITFHYAGSDYDVQDMGFKLYIA